VYFGTRRTRAANVPFSFFPARIMRDTPPLFARPELRPIRALRGVITPANMQGVKVTTGLTANERDAIWAEIARQVTRQHCGLGHHAWAPPTLDSDQAHRIALQNPKPVMTRIQRPTGFAADTRRRGILKAGRLPPAGPSRCGHDARRSEN
jgi:hypothetical protein